MALTYGKLLKPFFRLSVNDFPKLVARWSGWNEDLDRIWPLFEPVARHLVNGFTMALEDDRFTVLVPRLEACNEEFRGIAYEGAGMGLMLLDSLGPWKKRFPAFLAGPGAPYDWLLHIGAGLALPRMPQSPDRFLAGLDPFLRWFVLDGFGFYEGFFASERSINRQLIPARVRGYGRRVFDHGLGRSLWFITGAKVDLIAATIGAFPLSRQADLWEGIGLACAYAACVIDQQAIHRLRQAAGSCAGHLAAGAAVATTLRLQTGESSAQTELACEALCGLSSAQVASIGRDLRQQLPPDEAVPAFAIWRQRLVERFALSSAQAFVPEERIS